METKAFEEQRMPQLISLPETQTGCCLAAMDWSISLHRYHSRLIPLKHCQSVTSMPQVDYDELRNMQKLVTLFLHERNFVPAFFEWVPRVFEDLEVR